MRRSTISSGNTFGAVHWSDGKMEALMLPDKPKVFRCGHCKTIFWIDDAKVLGNHGGYDPYDEYSGVDVPKDWIDAPYIIWLDNAGLQEAIGITNDRERQRYLRIDLWHRLNDPQRESEATEPNPPQALFIENLEMLTHIFDVSNPHERVLKAEALRELGRHTEALELLRVILEEVRWIADQIRSLAEAGNTRVVKLETT